MNTVVHRSHTFGGTTSAEARGQMRHYVQIAHATLAECGIEMSPSKVSRLVRRFSARVERNGWGFFEFFSNAVLLSAAQRRAVLANPDVARAIAYRDPTGETAVNNVLRAVRRGR
ncbi:hypothetical protein [Mycobacteroides abscessus]|uniref:hypothetical protein n=1 Tax=Mycobacteroides abscessus TaxID=36809 RepID=UPI001F2F1FB4|nr:hypothetical protein [Mycobacteroides abscessus]